MQDYLHALEDWAIATGIRALKTGAEALVVLIGSNMVNIVELDWPYILGATATMMVVSIAVSIKGLPEVGNGQSVASLINEAKN